MRLKPMENNKIPKVSIIIRTKNEERWIGSCLEAVFSQDYKNFEVVLVDNNSTDKTISKARQFDVKILSIEEFLPGKALNYGIKDAEGKYICNLSGHCIPTNKKWLSNLARNLNLPRVAGVYGRQEPLSFTSDLDKRDLLITFGLDKRIQKKDPFFHNANSMIKKDVWESIPFDESVSNIEDRIWANKVLMQGYNIVYEPEASVYHHHGIHQERDMARCSSIVKVLEKLENNNIGKKVDINKLSVACVIPVKGDIVHLSHKPLIDYTIKKAAESKYIKHIILASDNPDYFRSVKGSDKITCLKRPAELSMDYVEIEDILKYAVDEIEKKGILPDLLVYMSVTFPFRPKHIIDNMIELLAEKGFDSVIPAIRENRSCWREENGSLVRIDEGFIPSKYKHPLHIGLAGLATVIYTEFIRKGERLGLKVGLYNLDDLVYSIDVSRYKNMQLAEKIIKADKEKDYA